VTTERLYYEDCYLTEFEGKVVDISADGLRIVLNRTAFYPTSGGQPHDLGELAGQSLLEVVDEEDGRVVHVLARPMTSDHSVVRGRIDWPRRYEHMQQHTGQHLLSAVLMELYKFPTLSFHMGHEVSTIELGTKEISEQQIAAAEMHANELARSGRSVQISFQDANVVEGLRKQSQRPGTLRIVEIDGVDKSACGGTHVRILAEILPLQIRKIEKVRGNARMEFVCGVRAIRRVRQDFKILQELARQTASPMDQLPEAVTGLKERSAIAEKERERLATELAQREGRDEYSATTPSADGVKRKRWLVHRLGAIERTKALAYAGGTKSLVLMVGNQPPGVLIACSPDSGIDVGTVLKDTMAAFGGRGGGSSTLAQGNVSEEAAVEALAAKLGMQ
jgi:alanyl-tRNA synthetase